MIGCFFFVFFLLLLFGRRRRRRRRRNYVIYDMYTVSFVFESKLSTCINTHTCKTYKHRREIDREIEKKRNNNENNEGRISFLMEDSVGCVSVFFIISKFMN